MASSMYMDMSRQLFRFGPAFAPDDYLYSMEGSRKSRPSYQSYSPSPFIPNQIVRAADDGSAI